VFVAKVSGPFDSEKEAIESRKVFIRVQMRQDAVHHASLVDRGITPNIISPPADDIYRIERQPKGFIVVLDDPSL
jgi:hypothetical protein